MCKKLQLLGVFVPQTTGPIAGFKGPTSKGREGKKVEGGEGKEWGGKGVPPF